MWNYYLMKFSMTLGNRIGGVMVGVLTSSAVDCGFKP